LVSNLTSRNRGLADDGTGEKFFALAGERVPYTIRISKETPMRYDRHAEGLKILHEYIDRLHKELPGNASEEAKENLKCIFITAKIFTDLLESCEKLRSNDVVLRSIEQVQTQEALESLWDALAVFSAECSIMALKLMDHYTNLYGQTKLQSPA
jgi:hypothetical protein